MVVNGDSHLTGRTDCHGSRLITLIAVNDMEPFLCTFGITCKQERIGDRAGDRRIKNSRATIDSAGYIDIILCVNSKVGTSVYGYSTFVVTELMPDGRTVVGILGNEHLCRVLHVTFRCAISNKHSIAVQQTGYNNIVLGVDNERTGLCTIGSRDLPRSLQLTVFRQFDYINRCLTELIQVIRFHRTAHGFDRVVERTRNEDVSLRVDSQVCNGSTTRIYHFIGPKHHFRRTHLDNDCIALVCRAITAQSL